MKKFIFKKFSYRIGNLELRNSITYHDHFELVKWSKNRYYKTEYLYEESFGGEYFVDITSNSQISKDCFKYPETCYTLASFINIYNTDSICVKSCGDRLFILDDDEYKTSTQLLKSGFLEIIKQLEEYGSNS